MLYYAHRDMRDLCKYDFSLPEVIRYFIKVTSSLNNY